MLTIYPIYEDQNHNRLHIDLILDKNGKKYLDGFGRYTLIVEFYTAKYYTGSKMYKHCDPLKILDRFGISGDDKNNIGGLTVKEAIQKGMDYINGKIKHL